MSLLNQSFQHLASNCIRILQRFPAKRSLILPFLIFVAAILPHPDALGQYPAQENRIKGAFLFNFAKFTDWPETAFASSDAPFVIGILGADPFGAFLDALVAGEKIKGHPIEIQRYNSFDEAGNCHILFINSKMGNQTQAMANALKGKHILTVSDRPDFTARGGMVKFYLDDQKMRFQVNIEEAKNSGLVLSSKLLRLADICCDE